MSDLDLTVHAPVSLVAGTGDAAALLWTHETVNGKGHLTQAHHSLRLTPAMLPMLTAAVSTLLALQPGPEYDA